MEWGSEDPISQWTASSEDLFPPTQSSLQLSPAAAPSAWDELGMMGAVRDGAMGMEWGSEDW